MRKTCRGLPSVPVVLLGLDSAAHVQLELPHCPRHPGQESISAPCRGPCFTPGLSGAIWPLGWGTEDLRSLLLAEDPGRSVFTSWPQICLGAISSPSRASVSRFLNEDRDVCCLLFFLLPLQLLPFLVVLHLRNPVKLFISILKLFNACESARGLETDTFGLWDELQTNYLNTLLELQDDLK